MGNVMEWNRVYVGDALECVSRLPAESIRCTVTSPPYFHQRDYGVAGQWGQEDDPDGYVDNLVRLCREVRRALTVDGTLWMNLGDSYCSNHRGGRFSAKYANKQGQLGPPVGIYDGCKRKDLLGVPWMVAFALRKDGWYLRQDIIWYKTNPMPESVQDRCTRSHEYIFMFSKSRRYYYDHLAIATPLSASAVRRMGQDIAHQAGLNRVYGKANGPMKAAHTVKKQGGHGQRHAGLNERGYDAQRVANRKSVWPIATAMSKEDHYAVTPPMIPQLCIKAGSQEGDVILDPFIGTGTAMLEASALGRRYIGFDLNPKNVGIAQRRLRKLEGLFYRG